MNPEQLQQMVTWIDQQIMHLDDSIIEAQKANNYGRKIQYEGMRDAFSKCLGKLKNTKKEKIANKPTTTND